MFHVYAGVHCIYKDKINKQIDNSYFEKVLEFCFGCSSVRTSPTAVTNDNRVRSGQVYFKIPIQTKTRNIPENEYLTRSNGLRI